MDKRTVLDFGCGTGANCKICHCDYYYGIDPDAERIRFAKTLFPAYQFMVFDSERIPLPDETVEIILVVAVLHHISDDRIAGYLHEFGRVLKPGGTVIVIEPFLRPENKLNNWFMTRFDNGAFIRTEEDYLRLFNQGRFQCEVLNKFRKGFFYQELLFSALPGKEVLT